MHRDSKEAVQYIKNMQNGSTAGFKYFSFQNLKRISVRVRGCAEGMIDIKASSKGDILGCIPVNINRQEWQEFDGNVFINDGVAALYFTFKGNGSFDFQSFHLQ